MSRYLCIHGHFYQPPRENPWLEAIELQDSAYPYHDWNERITAECYAPNAASRILDHRKRIVRIVNNYSKISFNVGPTLLAWLETRAPETYAAVLEADGLARERFGGHGSALAQVYNHMILPLADERDKRTQVRWGVRDFEHRFGREPEGMWLPETAVDIPTLEVLAAEGIRFTVLAPNQAGRVRPLSDAGEGREEEEDDAEAGDGGWEDVSGGRVDPTRPYLQRLPSGAEIVVFFYDGPVSRAVAFERLLHDGANFASRLMTGFSELRERPQLVHIATDGETYGHHHAHGEMALSFALDRIEEREDVRLTNYGEFLERHPPEHEVEIVENTSWSCAHGIERWRSDCGCSTGGEPGWSQAWRRPLREALDWLRDRLAPVYEERAGRLLRDPWAARDAYIDVILDRSPARLEAFLEAHASERPSPERRVELLELLELQRHAMLMYTSCGWFFTDLAGIETVQVIQYAGRAVQLAEKLSDVSLEPEFLDRLENARSNVSEEGSGRRIYQRRVEPTKVDLRKVCAHWALSSLFEPAERDSVYCYTVRVDAMDRQETGKAKLVTGRAEVASDITGEAAVFSYAAVHFGDHNVHGAVRRFRGEEAFGTVHDDLADAFERAEFAEAIRLLDDRFEGGAYSVRSLFRDEQRRIVERILEPTLEEAESGYRSLYERHAPLMRFVARLGMPQPTAFGMAANYLFNTELERALEAEEPDRERIAELLEEAAAEGVELDVAGLGFAFRTLLRRVGERFAGRPDDLDRLREFRAWAELAVGAPFGVELWDIQNLYWELLQGVVPRRHEAAAEGEEGAGAWLEEFGRLGELLSVAV